MTFHLQHNLPYGHVIKLRVRCARVYVYAVFSLSFDESTIKLPTLLAAGSRCSVSPLEV